ncbi:MAG: hypothetical protein KA767_07415 [Saprospiraceae bacterium]|nr:hypothetical protein [Saprospiraceae bacterium]
MNSTFKQIIFISLFTLCSSISVWAGFVAVNPTLTHSPSNPVAGQTVTFSVSDSDVSSCESVRVAPDLENNPGLLLPMTFAAGFYTATHTYPAPGTYQVGYDVLFDACPAFRDQPKNNRALETFDFGPVGGPFVTSTDNGNFIFAPLVIAAPAPIPTMGQWGIIILGLLTTIFGVVMVNEQYIRLAKIKS